MVLLFVVCYYCYEAIRLADRFAVQRLGGTGQSVEMLWYRIWLVATKTLSFGSFSRWRKQHMHGCEVRRSLVSQ